MRQTQTVDFQTGEVNKVNIVKCFNRFPVPKLDFKGDLKVWDRESDKAFHNNVYFIILPCQSAGLQSVFVPHC